MPATHLFLVLNPTKSDNTIFYNKNDKFPINDVLHESRLNSTNQD